MSSLFLTLQSDTGYTHRGCTGMCLIGFCVADVMGYDMGCGGLRQTPVGVPLVLSGEL